MRPVSYKVWMGIRFGPTFSSKMQRSDVFSPKTTENILEVPFSTKNWFKDGTA